MSLYLLGNAHIYEEHIDALKEQVKNEPFPFPTMTIKNIRENIDDYEETDFEIHNYVCHQKVKMDMVQ